MNIFTSQYVRERFRSKSMHNIKNPKFYDDFIIKDPKELSFYERINSKLLEIKEFRWLYKKLKIPPFFYVVFVLLILFYIVLKLFIRNISLSIATIFPLLMTFKALHYRKVKDKKVNPQIVHWLKYWVFYSFILNFETWFSYFLGRFYVFWKIILLFQCFNLQSTVLEWIYDSILIFFNKYRTIIETFTQRVFDILAEDNDDNSDDEDEGIIGGFIHNRIQQGRAAINLLNRLN